MPYEIFQLAHRRPSCGPSLGCRRTWRGSWRIASSPGSRGSGSARAGRSRTCAACSCPPETRPSSRSLAPCNIQCIYTVSQKTRFVAVRNKRLAWENVSEMTHFVSLNSILHRESKKQDTKLLPITSPNINRFSKFYHC